MNKTDFDNKLTSLNRRITSNKTKHLEVQKKLNSLMTKDHNVFFGRNLFYKQWGISKHICLSTNTLELKKDQDTDYVLSWKSKEVLNSQLKPLFTAFLNSMKRSD